MEGILFLLIIGILGLSFILINILTLLSLLAPFTGGASLLGDFIAEEPLSIVLVIAVYIADVYLIGRLTGNKKEKTEKEKDPVKEQELEKQLDVLKVDKENLPEKQPEDSKADQKKDHDTSNDDENLELRKRIAEQRAAAEKELEIKEQREFNKKLERSRKIAEENFLKEMRMKRGSLEMQNHSEKSEEKEKSFDAAEPFETVEVRADLNERAKEDESERMIKIPESLGNCRVENAGVSDQDDLLLEELRQEAQQAREERLRAECNEDDHLMMEDVEKKRFQPSEKRDTKKGILKKDNDCVKNPVAAKISFEEAVRIAEEHQREREDTEKKERESIEKQEWIKKTRSLYFSEKSLEDNILKLSQKKLPVSSGFVNDEVHKTFLAYIEKEEKLLETCKEIDLQLGEIRTSLETKSIDGQYSYLVSQKDLFDRLKRRRSIAYGKLGKQKIELLKENEKMAECAKKAFSELLHSKKIISSNGTSITDLGMEVKPEGLKFIKYAFEPLVLVLDSFYYCFFSNIVLMFDEKGDYVIALDPTALEIIVEKVTDYLVFTRNTFPSHKYIAEDSRCVQRGDINRRWLHSCRDGSMDLRYKNNYLIEYRRDLYEYYKISISIAGKSYVFFISSFEASQAFESMSNIYVRKCTGVYDPIPNLLYLLRIIDKKSANVRALIKANEKHNAHPNTFCRIIHS